MSPTLGLISNLIFLSVVVGIPLYGLLKKVNLFAQFVIGAQEGLAVILKIVPFLVGMLVAIGMFRASGAIEQLARWIGPFLNTVGIPSEILPLALVRPLSGSAANGMAAEIIHTHGGDSFISQVAATLVGSTETTFYVLAIYFGAVAIQRTRHAILVGLIADAVGIFVAVWVCRWLLL